MGSIKDASYSSFVNNQTLPGALNVELDVTQFTYADPGSGSWCRVWGISRQEIAQASNLNGSNISIFAGMQKGLPLANPAQSGLIIQGQIQQAFGNWIGNEMTLDFILRPPTGTGVAPVNLTWSWAKGQQMSDALKQTLTTGFPKFTINVNISQRLTQQRVETGYHYSLDQLATYVKKRSADILGGKYTGVDITTTGASKDGSPFSIINVYDSPGSAALQDNLSQVIQLQFQDMIGQPTWIDSGTVQVKFVMRADLYVGAYVQFPQAQQTTTQQSQTFGTNTKLTFQGLFQIQFIRHVGNFRQPDAASWVTVVNANAVEFVGMAVQ